jgi:hypothetical protein
VPALRGFLLNLPAEPGRDVDAALDRRLALSRDQPVTQTTSFEVRPRSSSRPRYEPRYHVRMGNDGSQHASNDASEGSNEKQGLNARGARLVSAVQENWVRSLVLLVAATIAAIATISGPVTNFYSDLTWRQAETERIESLRRGQTLDRMREQFGPPDRVADAAGLEVLVWEERG